MVRLTDRPDMTLEVYRECKTTTQHTLKQTAGSKSVPGQPSGYDNREADVDVGRKKRQKVIDSNNY